MTIEHHHCPLPEAQGPGPGTCNLWHQRADCLVRQADPQVDKSDSMHETIIGRATEEVWEKEVTGSHGGASKTSAAKNAA